MNVLLIGVGGALGAICRYYLGVVISRKITALFPYATWVINISGSFLLGILFSLKLTGWPIWLFGVGFCGAYTTFSTFGNEAVQLFVANQTKTAFLYIFASLVVSLFAAWLGFMI